MTETPVNAQPPRSPSIVFVWQSFSFVGLLIVALLLATVCSMIVGLCLKGMGLADADANLNAFVALYLFAGINVIILSGFLCRQFDGLSLRALGLGFDRPWLRHILLGGLAGAGLVTLTWAVMAALGWVDTGFNEALPARLPRLATTLLFCLAIAVFEEVVFRGYLFQVGARRNVPLSILASGLLFVLIHLRLEGGQEYMAMVNTFIVHVLLALCYLRTRSLWLPISLHTAWNFTECFVFGMPFNGMKPTASILVSERLTNFWSGHDYGPDGGGVVTVTLCAAIVVAYLFLRQRHPRPDIMAVDTPQAPRPAIAPTPAAAPPAMSRPVQRDRILAIDVLRGISVLGILPMNMTLFAQISSACLNPCTGAFTDDTNVITFVILRFFIGTKDLMVFSMLFGAGVVMLDTMKRADGQSQTALHFRRMAVIFGFGLVHAYLIWFGDILVTYAVCGCLIYPFRRLGAGRLITLGSIVFMLPMTAILVFQVVVPHLSPGLIDTVRMMFYPPQELQDAFIETYRQGWLGQMTARAESALTNQVFGIPLCMGPIGAGMMLIGMGLYKLGVLTGRSSDRTYVWMIVAAVVAGFPMLLYGFYWSFAHDWQLPDGYFLGWFLRETSYGIIVLGWIGRTMLACRHGQGVWICRALAAVGQLALSNYLMQSVICSLIYYGHGLGLVGRVDHLHQIYITLGIWAFQLVVSPLYLKRYQIGPAEWLWRSLTIGNWQRLRRRAPQPGEIAARAV